MSTTATATITQICDAVVQLIDKTYALVSPNTVERAYLPDVDTLPTITGRKVYVAPGEYGQADTATRGLDRNSFTVHVITIRRFEDAGEPTLSWVDDEIDFVESMWRVLTEIRTRPLLTEITEVLPITSRVVLTYDEYLLREKKLFFSAFEVVYEIDEA